MKVKQDCRINCRFFVVALLVMEEVSLYYFRRMGGTDTAVPAKAVRVLFAFSFHISEIKEQMGVQGRSLLRCLFYRQFVIKGIYSAAVERIFSDRHLTA